MTHAAFEDGSEHFVILGGTEEHCEIYSSGHACPLLGYSLDLSTMEWRQGDANGDLPEPRMRFAAERYGQQLLCYGGHGNRGSLLREEQLVMLDLVSLVWRRCSIKNEPHSFPSTPAATLAGGCLLGGVDIGGFGIRPIPKFDILVLASPEDPESDSEEEDEEKEDSLGDIDMEDNTIVHVQLHDADGNIAPVAVPNHLLQQMLAQHQSSQDEDGELSHEEG
jgi:hypothetical protein